MLTNTHHAECVPDIFRYDSPTFSYRRRCLLCGRTLDMVDATVAGYLAQHMFDAKGELLRQAILRHEEGLPE